MFRFYKYDETGYKDFGNSIFSNLDHSQIDSDQDKITIDNVDYRLSSVKELCDNCNHSDTTNYEIMTNRPTLRTITTPGAIGTIPATGDHTDGSWLPTDLYNGEVLINTTDQIAYVRSGNEIRSWNLNPVVFNEPISFEFADPDNITVGNPPVIVTFYGSGFDQISDIDYDALLFGVTISDFQILSQSMLSMIMDPSQAYIGGSSGEMLEIHFITVSGDSVKFPISLLAQSTPPGDPVITGIQPFSAPFFVSGEQTILIVGQNLDSHEGLSVNPQNDMITILSQEFDPNGNILVQIDLPAELLNTNQNFVLSYEGYQTEAFQVFLSGENPPDLLSITYHPDGVSSGNITFNISLNHDISELELVEVQSEFDVSVTGFNYTELGVVEVHMDTTQMNTGEIFSLRVSADGQITNWTEEIAII